MVLIAALAMVFTPNAGAQDQKPKDDVFTLGEIEVKDQSEVSKNVTIEKIYQEDMRDFNKNTVGQAVNMLPGVTLTKTRETNRWCTSADST
jgi:hypothetical protein